MLFLRSGVILYFTCCMDDSLCIIGGGVVADVDKVVVGVVGTSVVVSIKILSTSLLVHCC